MPAKPQPYERSLPSIAPYNPMRLRLTACAGCNAPLQVYLPEREEVGRWRCPQCPEAPKPAPKPYQTEHRWSPRKRGHDSGNVYFVSAEGTGRVKVGWTAGDVAQRLGSLGTSSPFGLRLLATVPGGIAHEHALHGVWAAHLAVAGREWFSLVDEIQAWIDVARSAPTEFWPRLIAHYGLELSLPTEEPNK